MPFPQFDRARIRFHSFAGRPNRVSIGPDFGAPPLFGGPVPPAVGEAAAAIRRARDHHRPVMLAFGAHAIKNGLGPVLIRLMEKGFLTHLATNGAGVIHDWELAFQGATSEHVAPNVAQGRFGHWQETGRYINLALLLGAWRGLGYGESVGKMIDEERLEIPDPETLRAEGTAASFDLLEKMTGTALRPGVEKIPHPYKNFSVQAAAFRLGIPLTGHPMFGHDIIYNHPLNCGAAVGRTAERDFLTFADGVSRLEGGVYLSVGSAVMSPMIFEKSMSMAKNLALQNNRPLTDYLMVVVDLQKSQWEWSRGEPPESNPDYYLRFMKSFSRMGGALRYLAMDNRDFFSALCAALHA